jgi:hypothetical protein
MNLKLEYSASVRGTVTYDKTNQPVEGLLIGIQGHKTSSWVQTISDQHGQFELNDINPEGCNLLAIFDDAGTGEPPDWTAKAVEIERLRPGEVKENVELILTKGGIVKGRVIDAKGIPLQGVDIAFYSTARPRSGAACQSTSSTKNGTWAYRFPPGEVYVYVRTNISGPSWSRLDYTLHLKEGEVINDIDFKLSRELPQNSPYRATMINPNVQGG